MASIHPIAASRPGTRSPRLGAVLALALALAATLVVPLAGPADAAGPRTAVAFVTQPRDVAPGGPLTVSVEVLDRDGLRTAAGNVDVTVSLVQPASLAGSARLFGTTRVRAVDGLASFDDLSIRVAAGEPFGRGYTLVATSGQLTPDTSRAFTLWQERVACAGGPCNASVTRGVGGLRVDVAAPVDAQRIDLGLTDEPVVCAGDHRSLPASVLVEVAGTAGSAAVASVRIDRAVVNQEVDNGAARYQLCYFGDKPFTDRSGALVATPNSPPRFAGDPLLFGGLLPDCGPPSQGRVAPCLAARSKTSGGDVLLEVLIPVGDPMFR
jgi:hypothetical protein